MERYWLHEEQTKATWVRELKLLMPDRREQEGIKKNGIVGPATVHRKEGEERYQSSS